MLMMRDGVNTGRQCWALGSVLRLELGAKSKVRIGLGFGVRTKVKVGPDIRAEATSTQSGQRQAGPKHFSPREVASLLGSQADPWGLRKSGEGRGKSLPAFASHTPPPPPPIHPAGT